jgi:hypothetical protein
VRIVFSWNEWNIAHIAKHAVEPHEAEYIVRNSGRGYPRKIGDGKLVVKGRTRPGRILQVIYVYPSPEEIDPDSLELQDLIDYSEGRAKVVYVIHAM